MKHGERIVTLLVVATVVITGIATGCAPATPSEEEGTPTGQQAEYEWRCASYIVREVRNTSVELFSDLVEQYSEGRIKVDFYPDGVLGSHDEIFHSVQEGTIEMALV
jgi:TRAP-type C4-dicarboxylate transport system substrate-binding protein